MKAPQVVRFSKNAVGLGSYSWILVCSPYGAVRFGQALPVSSISHADFSPDLTFYATASIRGIPRWNEQGYALDLWRLSDGAHVWGVESPVNSFGAVTISTDGKKLATTFGGSLQIRRVQDGQLLRSAPSSPANVIQFSPNGSLLAVGAGPAINVHWAANGRLLRSFPMPRGTRALAFAPNGLALAAADPNETIKVWRLNDGALIAKIQREAFNVHSLAFSDDGRSLAWGRRDATVVMTQFPHVAGFNLPGRR
jgi:WD40 repeat protein